MSNQHLEMLVRYVMSDQSLHPILTDEETKAQRCLMTCPTPHSQSVAEPELALLGVPALTGRGPQSSAFTPDPSQSPLPLPALSLTSACPVGSLLPSYLGLSPSFQLTGQLLYVGFYHRLLDLEADGETRGKP